MTVLSLVGAAMVAFGGLLFLGIVLVGFIRYNRNAGNESKIGNPDESVRHKQAMGYCFATALIVIGSILSML